MTDLNLTNQRTMAYWGAIEGATRNGATTAEVWQAVRDAASSLGYDSHGATIQDIAKLRSRAVSMVRADRALERSANNEAVRAETFAVAPYARDLAERNTTAMYQVRIQHTTETDGRIETNFRTITFTGSLPSTIGELRDQVEQDAEAMADQYHVAHVSVSGISILAI